MLQRYHDARGTDSQDIDLFDQFFIFCIHHKAVNKALIVVGYGYGSSGHVHFLQHFWWGL